MFEIRTVSGARHWIDDLNVYPDDGTSPVAATAAYLGLEADRLVGFVEAPGRTDSGGKYVRGVWINVEHIESITDLGDRYRA